MIRRSVRTAVAGLLLAAVVGCGNTLKDAPPNTSNKELPKPAVGGPGQKAPPRPTQVAQ